MSYQRSQFEKQRNKHMCKHSSVCYGFRGGYYYNENKHRYVKISSNSVKRYVKILTNKQFRRQFKAKLAYNLDDEQIIKTKEKLYNLDDWW